jgi:hypothetical protein
MRHLTWMAALAAATTLAACDTAPTAVPGPDARHDVSATSTSAPVPVITVVQKKPMYFSDGTYGRRHWLRGNNSYDPDGGSIVTYYWSSSCTYIPDGHTYEYFADIRSGDTCIVSLYVYDDENQVGWIQQTFVG